MTGLGEGITPQSEYESGYDPTRSLEEQILSTVIPLLRPESAEEAALRRIAERDILAMEADTLRH